MMDVLLVILLGMGVGTLINAFRELLWDDLGKFWAYFGLTALLWGFHFAIKAFA